MNFYKQLPTWIGKKFHPVVSLTAIVVENGMDGFVDPLGRPTVTAGCDHSFRTCCPFVPTFQNLAKQNTFPAKTVFTTGVWDCGSGRVDHLMTPLSCNFFFHHFHFEVATIMPYFVDHSSLTGHLQFLWKHKYDRFHPRTNPHCPCDDVWCQNEKGKKRSRMKVYRMCAYIL